MRRNIKLDYEDGGTIYLYTHWDGAILQNRLAYSLERARSRWTDESYLARVIFTDMTASVGEEITGYGLAPYAIDPQYPTLEVNIAKQTVNTIPFEDFLKNPQMFAV